MAANFKNLNHKGHEGPQREILLRLASSSSSFKLEYAVHSAEAGVALRFRR
jgi:hypothetical protein